MSEPTTKQSVGTKKKKVADLSPGCSDHSNALRKRMKSRCFVKIDVVDGLKMQICSIVESGTVGDGLFLQYHDH